MYYDDIHKISSRHASVDSITAVARLYTQQFG